ncbi:hypothetical protein [Algibacillus agarilyticus]|uniref:hypothetical protein n=1 Tax=Algibacillus agarilyticus TaxID=2234133 RepID=UPI000DD0E37C|nr:hypothetical protein [Algibacillus agarilyticus]
MAGKLAIYRYDDLSFPKFKYGYYLAGFGSKILLTFILAFVIHHAKSMFFQSDSKELADTIISTLIGAIVLATLISKLFTSQKAGIIVSSHYLVFGEQTVLYQNIESIKVDEQHLTFNMIRTDG